MNAARTRLRLGSPARVPGVQDVALRSRERPEREHSPAAPPLGWPLEARLEPTAPRRRSIDRPRVRRRLDVALESPAVVLSAPAGYGKTTLLAQLAEDDERPLAWLTLEAADDDAGTLIHGVAAALDRSESIDDPLRNALRAGTSALVPRALPRLARTLRRRERPLLLVLDGTEHLRSDTAQDALRVLLDHIPPGSNLVMASRGPLPPRTAKLRAEGRLAVLDAADLRADDAEVRAMLGALGIDSEPSVGEDVARRTEGWPAGIYLAALALRERPGEPLDGRLHGGEQTLREYFDDEVTAAMGRGDSAFLRRASILERLTPDACDAVLERQGSARVLERLADANLFVTRTGGNDRAYVLHPLFAEALRARLDRDEPALLRELHARASVWCADTDRYGEAIRHALAAGQTERATEILWSVMPAYEAGGRSGTLAHWLEAFDGRERERPALALTEAWIRIDAGDGDGRAGRWRSPSATLAARCRTTRRSTRSSR